MRLDMCMRNPCLHPIKSKQLYHEEGSIIVYNKYILRPRTTVDLIWQDAKLSINDQVELEKLVHKQRDTTFIYICSYPFGLAKHN